MKNIIKNLADLIKVKTIVTFVVIVVFSVLSLTGNIPAERAMDVVIMVVAFYFGTQAEKKNNDNNNTAQ